jgi:hypothetical protein
VIATTMYVRVQQGEFRVRVYPSPDSLPLHERWNACTPLLQMQKRTDRSWRVPGCAHNKYFPKTRPGGKVPVSPTPFLNHLPTISDTDRPVPSDGGNDEHNLSGGYFSHFTRYMHKAVNTHLYTAASAQEPRRTPQTTMSCGSHVAMAAFRFAA